MRGPLKFLLILLLTANTSFAAVDPLPSWNNTAPKKAIVAFVEKVTKPVSPGFVQINKRIATFDNDGTLWSEQPVYFQYYFAADRIKALAPKHPEWKKKQPFASILKGDLKSAFSIGDKALMEMFVAAQEGLTTEEFEKVAAAWINKARHPKTKRLYREMVYQPMIELLSYLRASGFKTYIVSGGDRQFMLPWTEKVYGIPPEQVIGSELKMKFELRNGKPVIVALPQLGFINDRDGKPLGIQSRIGRRPIASFGNSDGDLPMMQWTAAGSGPSFCMYIHHTDAKREWAYDRKSAVGRLDKGLDMAKANGWTVVDMKKDWRTVYSFGEK
ncbi:MAG: HAD family hydrolase [Candidatus Margulisiibacteriota bacterium]